jgi:hypothetical protein
METRRILGAAVRASKRERSGDVDMTTNRDAGPLALVCRRTPV